MVAPAKSYEGMFLVDNKFATREWNDDEIALSTLLDKHGGEVVRGRRWAERKLAYEIGGHKRAVYYLIYFKMPPQNMDAFRRDVQLSENVIRHLVITHSDERLATILQGEDEEEQRRTEEAAAAAAEAEAEAPAEAPAEESKEAPAEAPAEESKEEAAAEAPAEESKEASDDEAPADEAAEESKEEEATEEKPEEGAE